METNREEKIVSLLVEVIHLLMHHQQERWAKVMKDLLNNYANLTHSKTKKEAAELIMKSMLGGMGSLSDVVLYKNGVLLTEENDKLEALLDELYVLCKRKQTEGDQ